MIGIGGSGMSAATAVLLHLDARISGSDSVPFEGMGRLVESGARVTVGHRAEAVPADTDLVVASAAVPESNPELAAARRANVPVISYAKLLGLLMQGRAGVAIAGTHGKSTTTAMCAFLFRAAGLAPSYVIGAGSAQLGGNGGVGTGPHLIVEACEFNRSFLELRPTCAAVLNVERDHVDYFKTIDDVVDAFSEFARRVAPEGLLVVNGDDPLALNAAAVAAARVETFGFGPDADWQAVNISELRGCYQFDVKVNGRMIMSTRLAVPGKHNVANALAAIALAHAAGAEPRAIAEALPRFLGIARRMSFRGTVRGATVVDDYAHHPTEVRATLAAMRAHYRPVRTLVVFQPHQATRLSAMLDQFADALRPADHVIVPDVFGARETSDHGVNGSSERLVSQIRRIGGRAEYIASLEAVTELVAGRATEGDLVVVMGAGDVWKVSDGLVGRLR